MGFISRGRMYEIASFGETVSFQIDSEDILHTQPHYSLKKNFANSKQLSDIINVIESISVE
jgi:hypothetical protein